MNDAAVLFVDDEANILNALRRAFSETGLTLLTAESGEEALALLDRNEIAVVVSDNRMPGMSGVDLLQQARERSPDCVRILLTGYADVQAAIDAINKGEVYRFVTKPWNDDDLRDLVLQAVEKYRVVQSLSRADEGMLLSLAQTIELKDPYTRGHCDRVALYSQTIGRELGLDETTIRHIRHGSWLHDCGKIGVPERILNFPGPLDPHSRSVMNRHPEWGAEVARQARLNQTVVDIIYCHHERFDGEGYPSRMKGEDIPLPARIVAVADIFDALSSDRPYRKGHSISESVSMLEATRGEFLDPALVDIFSAYVRRIYGLMEIGEV